MIVVGGIGAPPDQILVSDSQVASVAFGAFISAMNTVIAPTVNVGRCRSITSTAAWGSKRWNSTSGAPVHSDSRDVRDQPGDVEQRCDAEDHVVAVDVAPLAVGVAS